jgi:hypothetical protein
MKVCKIILLAALFSATTSLNARSTDDLRINKLERSLQKEVHAREQLNVKLTKQKEMSAKQAQLIDSLQIGITRNTQNIQKTAEGLGVKIDEINTNLGNKAEVSDVKTKTIEGGIIILIIILLSGIIYYLLHKRINKSSSDVMDLKEKTEKLNEDILNNFTLEMSEMQKMTTSLQTLSKATASTENTAMDHSLIKTLADRITFMEMTLYKMDSGVRGYKQLTRSISQMKDNLLANGYEIVDMLGKPYNEGMKAAVSFIDDESIEKGLRTITGIVKPQINYKGVMIQSAQITVSQNI